MIETKIDPAAIAARLQEEDRALTIEGQKRWPVHANRATLLAHPCPAYTYWNRVAWADLPMFEPELEDRLRVGREREPQILNRVEEVAKRVGAEVRRVRETFHEQRGNISGEVDALLRMGEKNAFDLPRGTQMVIEIKTVSPYLWDSCTSLDAMREDKWLSKYLAQVTLYQYFAKLEYGLFVLENLNGQRRYVGFAFDWALADALLKKAEIVEEAVRTKTVPAKLNDPAVCRDCPALALCGPALKYGPSAEFADEESLISALAEREQMAARIDQDVTKRYKKLDEQVKATIKSASEKEGTSTLIVGDWVCEVKKTASQTRVSIERLER